jgi:two-component SAPR family response regulator
MFVRIFVSLFLTIAFSFNSLSQGLRFQGIGIFFEKRSSYSVFDGNEPRFKEQFEINFKFSIHDIHSFGCIFLLHDKGSGEKYNLMYIRRENAGFLKFNIGGKKHLFTIKLDDKKLSQHALMDFSSHFFLDGDSIRISVDDYSYCVGKLNLPKTFVPDLTFGFNESCVDMATYVISDLKIRSNKEKFEFPLNESNHTEVHNSKGKVVGHVSNPVWMINDNYYWKLRFEIHSRWANGINYHASSHKMLFFDSDSIRKYDMLTNKLETYPYTNNLPVNMWLGAGFTDNANNRLYVYEVADCFACNATVASLDLVHHQWTSLGTETLPMQLHHHSGYFDTERNQYIIFGGFGNRKYNNQFYSFDLNRQKWDTIPYSGDKIKPRYFQGMAEYEGSLYLFGGMGNETGDQTIGKYNFYDLHKFDLHTKECVKLWEINWKEKHVVPARNMVVLEDSLLYVLCYPEYESNSYAQLYQFSIKDGTYTVLGDSIHFRSDEILTNLNLYYDDILRKFYCTVQVYEEGGASSGKVYSLNYVSIPKAGLSIYEQEKSKHTWRYIFACIVGIIVFMCYLWKRKTVKKVLSTDADLLEDQTSMKQPDREKSNAIYLFGAFALFDKKGKNITYMLSTRLRNAFLIIMEYSLKEGGITSQALTKLLWSDKDEFSAKNLRGVTINHLRKILSELEDVELIHDKGFYRLLIGEKCFCDCKYMLELIDTSNATDKYMEISAIIQRGRFLKSIDDTATASFKLFVDEKLSSILPTYIEEVFLLQNYLLAAQLSSYLLSIDPLNDAVFAFQIRSLCHLKQISEAKKQYAFFTTQYYKLTNLKYPNSLFSLVGNINLK